MNRYFIITFLFLACSGKVFSQKIALKTNALYWATASPNAEVEIRMNPHITFSFSGIVNPFTFGDTQLHLTQVAPEIRYWLERPMARHFIGITGSLTEYDLILNNRCYEGNAFAAGVTYGYAFVLSKRWNIEATLGIGCIKYNAFDYKNGTPKPDDPNKKGTQFAPIKAGVSFAYILY